MKDKSEKIYEHWNEFRRIISYENRYFVNHEILDHIASALKSSELDLRKGDILYRARIYTEHLNFVDAFKHAIKSLSKEDTDESGYEALRNRMNMMDLRKRMDTGFWGYDSEGSFVPKDNKVVRNGRANPERIKYLYVADEPMTAVVEVRPLIGNHVSVAEIEVQKDLKIADLSYDLYSKVSEEYKMLAYLIIEEFSKPNNGEPFEYLVTQYITEYIKTIGYDGIKFGSSLYRSGRNYVIFNFEQCVPKSSKLYELDDVCLELRCIGPVGVLYGEEDIYHWKLENYRSKLFENVKKIEKVDGSKNE